MTVNHDVAGSNPASGANGLFVKRLRHRPFTAGSGVRIPHRSPWAISSAGRASALQAECQQFDPVIAHQKKASRDPLRGAFFLPFFFFLYSHITSCIRDSLHFVPRFAPSKCVRYGTSSILLSPTKRKRHVLRAVGFLLPIFLFPHLSFPLPLKNLCQAFLKMSRKKHFISPIFRGLKEGKSKTKSKNAFYRSSFNVSLL